MPTVIQVNVETGERVEREMTPDEIAAIPVPEINIPQVVSSAQGGIALIQVGYMPAVQSVIDAADTPAEVKWAWERATQWERGSPALAFIANAAGITDEQMDELFIAADQIKV